MLEVLRAMCGNAATPSLVEQYFAPGRFAGRTFIDLAPNDPYWIGEADLLAVTLVDVSFPPASVRWFLDLTNQSALSDLLRALPSPASELHTLEREALAGGDGLWRLFARHEAPPGTTFTRLDKELRGIGPVKADKLMARKRPGIFPIYDRAFEELFGHGEGFDYWDATMWVLRDDSVRESLLSLVDGVPVVRILDAVVWMGAGVRGEAPWQPSGGRIIRRIEAAAGESFSHYKPARYFLRNEDDLLPRLGDAALGRFVALFERVNQLLS